MKKKTFPTRETVSRREFLRDSALFTAGLAVGSRAVLAAGASDKPLNYNEKMEYRRCGKTGLMVSCVCLGGHWKRLDTVVADLGGDVFNMSVLDNPAFIQNRHDIVSRCIDEGINYIDACIGAEVMAYSKALKGRRDKMYLGYSWYEKEMRFDGWRTADKLLEGFNAGLKAAGLDYVDLWRITCHEQGGNHTFHDSEEVAAALDTAKKQGKARFTGISSHDRPWLKMMIEEFPDQIEVVVTPYTAKSKVLPADSLFDAVKKCDVGVFGIKPFASNSLFKGDSALDSPDAEEDDRRARLAIRYVLANPAITAPIPGLINQHQVENVVKAVQERRELDTKEAAELEKAASEAWARLPADYQWLKKWEYV
ncbi:MAG: aldo/keto reductase [Candidatus Omnitrophica bacterium]|nr:aldo/keto reductase [Candidatus Omnitrophota bacterium]